MTAIGVGSLRLGLRTTDHHTRVALSMGDVFAGELEPAAAEAIGRALVACCFRLPARDVPSGWQVETTEPAAVVLTGPTGRVATLPQRAAEGIAGHLITAAKMAEERNEAERIAHDQAHLLRMGGIPLADGGVLRLGLTEHPQICDLAGNLAATDDKLRRYLPGGVRATAHFPRPGVFDARRYRQQQAAQKETTR